MTIEGGLRPTPRRFRTGSHWGRTLIREGVQPADAHGRRPDDALVGVVDDPVLAARICDLLNTDQGRADITRIREGNDHG